MIRPEAVTAVMQAKAAGCRLAILSNELDLSYGADFRRKLPLLAHFELNVDATYSGVLKPDPRAYAAVTDALQLPPQACVFVDDQLRNIEGARRAGWRTVHFDVSDPAEANAQALGLLGILGLGR